jgi:hypothetical protein
MRKQRRDLSRQMFTLIHCLLTISSGIKEIVGCDSVKGVELNLIFSECRLINWTELI